jgi:hypothetical protein
VSSTAGSTVATTLGPTDGAWLASVVGSTVAAGVRPADGAWLSACVGSAVSTAIGPTVGVPITPSVGAADGLDVEATVGAIDGAVVGAVVGASVETSSPDAKTRTRPASPYSVDPDATRFPSPVKVTLKMPFPNLSAEFSASTSDPNWIQLSPVRSNRRR